MLICSVVQRAPRRAIAADIAEAATAADATATGQVVFATLVDDPASVGDIVDAFLGEIMVEAASADDSITAGGAFDAAVAEAGTATDLIDATVSVVASTWNPSDKSANITLSGLNLVAQSTNTTDGAVRSTIVRAPSSGKFYFEITVTASTQGTDTGCGVANASASLTLGAAPTNACITYAASGNIWLNNANTGKTLGGGGFVIGGTICFALDLVNQRIWIRKTTGNWNGTVGADPATNVGGIDTSAIFSSIGAFAVACFQHASPIQTVNFGASSFVQTIPSGFTAWN